MINNLRIFLYIKRLVMVLCLGNLMIYIPVYAFKIPDSGQFESITNTYGEDSDYLINNRSYSKLDQAGNKLDINSTNWSMIHDNITGLTWEIKTDDDSEHDKDNKYTWYSTDIYIKSLNSKAFGSYTDWRLPSLHEIASLVNLSKEKNIDTNFFPNNVNSLYWTSDSFMSFIWSLNFNNGAAVQSFKNIMNNIRAVRGITINNSNYLIVNGDGTVTDTRTGLMWQRDSSKTAINWVNALSLCENLVFVEYDDWRLPNREELRSIIDYSKNSPAINNNIFKDTYNNNYWSSSWNDIENNQIWGIDMTLGNEGTLNDDSLAFVRAVRCGQKITSNAIEILSPDQNSTWQIGDIMKIKWNYPDLTGKFSIYLSRKGGKPKTFETIIAPVLNTGTYDWKVEGDASYNCVLKINPWDNDSNQNYSGIFTINNINSGLAINLPFDGSLYDLSGKNNHAEDHGSFFSNDRLNNNYHALKFIDSDNYIDISSILNDINGLSSLTYSFWINPNKILDPEKNENIISLINETNSDQQVNIKLYDKRLMYEVINKSSKGFSLTDEQILQPDIWSYITITVNDMTIKIYHNGIEVYEIAGISLPVHFNNSFSKMTIGSNENSFSGKIDDFRIYDRILSDSEIKDLYEIKILAVNPDYMFISSDAGFASLSVFNKGGNDMHWTAFSDCNWLTIINGNSGVNNGVIDIQYEKNNGGYRNANIEITAIEANNYSINVNIVQDKLDVVYEEKPIENTPNGSVIVFPDGFHKLGKINLEDKNFEIRSENGAENCIIETLVTLNNSNIIFTGITFEKSFINVTNSSPIIKNCIIKNNLYDLTFTDSSVEIVNCVIANNLGNGIYSIKSSLNIIHCTIVKNIGAGIFADRSSLSIVNSIIRNNNMIKRENPEKIIKENSEEQGVNLNLIDTISDIKYSNIQEIEDGPGNINSEPMFTNFELNDFRILEGSPCIDSGIEIQKMPFLDIIGNPRPKPAGSNPDMGAYENPKGKKDIYVFFPPDAKSYCPEKNGFITIMWDTSDQFDYYKFTLFEEITDEANIVNKDWVKGSYIMVPFNSLKQAATYYWSVISLPERPDAIPLTGSFHVLPEEECKDDTYYSRFSAFSLLVGLISTKDQISKACIKETGCYYNSGCNENDKIKVFTSFKNKYKFFFKMIQSNYPTARNITFPDNKNIKPIDVIIYPYRFRYVVLDNNYQWTVWR